MDNKWRLEDMQFPKSDIKERTLVVQGTKAIKAMLIACTAICHSTLEFNSASDILGYISCWRYAEYEEKAEDRDTYQGYLKAWESHIDECIRENGLSDADESDDIVIKMGYTDKNWDSIVSVYRYVSGDTEFNPDKFVYNTLAEFLAYLPVFEATCKDTYGAKLSHGDTEESKNSERKLREELGVPKWKAEGIPDLAEFQNLPLDEKLDAFYALALKIYEQNKG